MQFRVIVVADPHMYTNTQTNSQTAPITTHYAAKLSTQCKYHYTKQYPTTQPTICSTSIPDKYTGPQLVIGGVLISLS